MPLTLDGSSGITGVVNIQSTGSVLTGVTTVAAALWTDEVVAAYQAHIAEQQLP